MPNRPCWVEIATQALADNYRLLNHLSRHSHELPIDLLAIVKAGAYGHGLEFCAPAAMRAGARWLGVTSAEEAAAARQLCPEAEILVISGPFAGQGAAILEDRLTPVVWEDWQLDELEAAALAADAPEQSLRVHLELDTGMSRQGVTIDKLAPILDRFRTGSPLRLDGLMTHLYAADESDAVTTRAQFALLDRMIHQIIESPLQPALLHVGNSAALLAGEAPLLLGALCARYNLQPMLRPGLALYGIAPEFSPDEPAQATALRMQLRPVLAWKTRIVSVRTLAAGDVVGYNGTFVATEPMRVALLAVGYADGLRRALSNRGSVLVHGERAPIIGRISMDQTVIDITEIPAAAAGDEVTLIGQSGNGAITAEDHAHWAGTIPWEILTSIAARVPRFAL